MPYPHNEHKTVQDTADIWRTEDDAARAQALDVTGSFIVEAPAGAGKTALLTQRFLRLLARVNAPEHVIAVTFSKKAKDTMQARVSTALRYAQTEAPKDASPHMQSIVNDAKAVLAQDRKHDWQLMHHMQRLRIMTIDGFLRYLVSRMPFSSRIGRVPDIVDAPEQWYAQAVEATLQTSDTDMRHAVVIVMRYFLNRSSAVSRALIDLLRTREQWLMRIETLAEKDASDTTSERFIQEMLTAIDMACASSFGQTLPDWQFTIECAVVARSACGGDLLPEVVNGMIGGSALAHACYVADTVLTQKGAWRTGYNKNNGFPSNPKDVLFDRELLLTRGYTERHIAVLTDKAQLKAHKQRMIACVQALHTTAPQSADILHMVRLCGEDPSRDTTQQVVPDNDVRAALHTVLLRCAAHLRLLFLQKGACDHNEIALRAREALSHDGMPSQLAFALDYDIEHVLIDEFQDTSHAQFALFSRLFESWQPEDGKTLFCVGDPMQSIYRFRQADSSLFHRAYTHGIGAVRPAHCVLRRNFRSAQSLISTVNTVFTDYVGTANESSLTGGTPFRSAVAGTTAQSAQCDDSDAVPMTVLRCAHSAIEAETVADRIVQLHMTNPSASIAVLARTNRALSTVAAALRTRDTAFVQADSAKLLTVPLVRDAYTLTCALSDGENDTAWTALLRTPLFGCLLHEVAAIRGYCRAEHKSVASVLRQYAATTDMRDLPPVSHDTHSRIANVLRLFALHTDTHATLGRAVAAIMAASGVVQACDAAQRYAYRRFCAVLDAHEAHSDGTTLRAVIAGMYTHEAHEGHPITLMTVHKAKGLEFDHVFLCDCNTQTRSDGGEVLRWQATHAGMVYAVRPKQETKTGLWAAIGYGRGIQEIHETKRLFYVAVTRARHTVTCSFLEKAGLENNAFFNALAAHISVETHSKTTQKDRPNAISTAPHDLHRTPTVRRTQFTVSHDREEKQQAVLYRWAGTDARHVGTVVHNYLEHIAIDGLDRWDAQRIEDASSAIGGALAALGVPPIRTNALAHSVQTTLQRTLNDATGRWILSPHQKAQTEYTRVICMPDGTFSTRIIDRTFIADGIRWVIDYKTGGHSGGDTAAFLAQEKARYAAQLHTYGDCFVEEGLPIRCLLYFPSIQQAVSWDYDER